MTRAKIQKIQALRKAGWKITDIYQFLFPHSYSTKPSRLKKFVCRACKGIHYKPAWARGFR